MRVKALEAELRATRPSLSQPRPEADFARSESSDAVMRADDGQLTLGDEPGSSFFFGSAGSQFILGEAESQSGGRWSAMTGLGERSGVVSFAEILGQMPEREEAERYAHIYFEVSCLS